jgi:hypothetical protein
VAQNFCGWIGKFLTFRGIKCFTECLPMCIQNIFRVYNNYLWIYTSNHEIHENFVPRNFFALQYTIVTSALMMCPVCVDIINM